MADEPTASIPGYSGLTVIGYGGSSVVYKARQEAFDRFVAVKVLRGDFDEHSARRFLREAQLTGRLTGHPHVVTVLDAGTTHSGNPYLVTDLYERGSLQDRLAASGPLPAAEVAAVGAKIAGALADAHALGIIHRDVKPNNILVSRFGEPALADFGVAVVPDTLSAVTMVNAFTPHHAAPEILNGNGASPLTDVYSLGSTLYHLLVGQPPFAAGASEIAALLFRIVNQPAPAVECPELPGLAEVIARALVKEPAGRFSGAAAMAEALRRLVAGGAGGLAGAAAGAAAGGPEVGVPTVEVNLAGGVAAGQEVAGYSTAGVPLPPPVGSPLMTGPAPVPASPAVPWTAAPSAPKPTSATDDTIYLGPSPARTLEQPADPKPNRKPVLIGGGAVLAAAVTALALGLSGGGSQPSGPGAASHAAAVGDATSGAAAPDSSAGAALGAPGDSAPADGSQVSGTAGVAAGATGAVTPSGSAPDGATKAPGAPSGAAPTTKAATKTTTKAAPTTHTTTKPPVTCTSWPSSHVVADDGSGVSLGTYTLRAGPYETCTAAGTMTKGEHMYVWCHLTNSYGNTWVYGRLDSDSTAHWQSSDNFVKSSLKLGPTC